MNKILSFLAILALAAGLGALQVDPAVAQTGNGHGVGGFLDEDGDGFNDLAPDADGDGIPNGLDPDYVRPEDGSGNAWKHGDGEAQGEGFWFKLRQQFKGAGGNRGGDRSGGGGNGYGAGDGTGNGGVGPQDGTGNGPGTGDCDGSGSGRANGRR